MRVQVSSKNHRAFRPNCIPIPVEVQPTIDAAAEKGARSGDNGYCVQTRKGAGRMRRLFDRQYNSPFIK